MVLEETQAPANSALQADIQAANLVTSPHCSSAIIEAYHALLTATDIALGPGRGRVLAVASVDGTADAASVAANLGLIAGQSGERTVIVDANALNPHFDRLFSLPETSGFLQLLREEADATAVLRESAISTVSVVTCGGGGARHISLARNGDVARAIRALASSADRVVLAIAPVLTSIDVSSLGSNVDGLLLVVSPGKTRRRNATRACELLQRAGIPVLGIALTSQ